MFFATLTVGRLLGGFVVEKRGYLNSVMMSLFIGLILYVSGIIIGSNAIVLVCISGLFFSIAYPTVVITISKTFKDDAIYITGVIITAASIINMVLNNIIAKLNDLISSNLAFYIIPMSLLISIIFVSLIYKDTKKTLA
ncbi:hypothetical protein [Clostridium sp.]|uniref:hypothetical protein n=1 Tax=Clostridium sp. TaxID=1506 RepID=UPI0025C37CE0|nr:MULTISPECIES: hypothetical protein [unclassified Clostridium]